MKAVARERRDMSILAIDPGSERSAGVLYDPNTCQPIRWAKVDNDEMLRQINYTQASVLAIEWVASYGMPVGADVFETVAWAGRFIERWLSNPWRVGRLDPLRVYRRDVKLHLCGSMRAKDTNVRQALIDRYGGSREVAIGRKAAQGPLFGFTADCWQALAVAVTAAETVLAKAEAA